ncbi:hypothetical protein REPUB_Repub04eG0250300 [Reevesia pubescens]
MSETNNVGDVKKEEEVVDDSTEKDQIQVVDDDKDQICGAEVKDPDEDEKSPMPSAKEEEEAIKKKYGGLLPKKPPLISKDHDRAFFDSADWALGKQGAQKPKGPLEALRPKLQPTPHQQMRSRRSAYAPAVDDSVVDDSEASSPEEQSCRLDQDPDTDNKTAKEDHIQDIQDMHDT